MSNFPAPPTASHEPTEPVSIARWWLEDFARGPQHMGYIQGIRDRDWAEWARGLQSEVLAFLAGKHSALAAPVVAPAEPVAWAQQRFIHDRDGRPIGTDDPEVSWGSEPPDDQDWAPLFASPVSQGEQPALAQLAPIDEPRELRAALHGALRSLTLAQEVVCEYEEGGSATEAARFIQQDIESIRALLSEAVHPSPAPQEQPEPAGVPGTYKDVTGGGK